MKFIATIFAGLLMTSTAMADGLPAGTDSLTVGFGSERSVHDVNSYKGNITWMHGIGNGFALGAQTESYQTQGGDHRNEVRTSVEANAYYMPNITHDLSLKLGLGLGERMQSLGNFAYYALYAGANYNIGNNITLNAMQYRYRNAFDLSNNFETHQFGTGLTYNINGNNAIGAKIYRTFDGRMDRQADGGSLLYTVRF
jgi:hypothetical protein